MEYPFKDLLPLDEVLGREGYYKDWTHLDPEVFYSLTQISNFIKTKGFGVDVRLLIAQLAEHFGLKTTQVVDLANLLQQKFTNLEGVTQSFTNNINSLVAQMEADKDAVIANATVDSEVILARGGKPTLAARLDDTTAQLEQKVGVNIESVGCVADGEKKPHTYSGTNTSLDGVNRNIWYSPGNYSKTNIDLMQEILNRGENLFVPEGKFLAIGQLIVRHSNSTIQGVGLDKSYLIGTQIIYDRQSSLSNVEILDLSLENFVDITPPKQLTQGSGTDEFSLNEWQAFYHGTGFNGVDAAVRYSTTNTKKNGHVKFIRSKISNHYYGMSSGVKQETNILFKDENVEIKDSVFDNIIFQALGFNSTNGINVENNLFKNIYFQPIDISRGNTNTRIRHNVFDRCGHMLKTEGFSTIDNVVSTDTIIEYNEYTNPPTGDSVHFKQSAIFPNLTGVVTVRNNILYLAEYHTSAVILADTVDVNNSLENDIEINNNKFIVNNGVGLFRVLLINGAVNKKGFKTIKLMNNLIVSKRPSRMIDNTYNNVGYLIVENNKFENQIPENESSLIRGQLPLNTRIVNNDFINVGSQILNVTNNNALESLYMKENSFLHGNESPSTTKVFLLGTGSLSKIEILDNTFNFISLFQSSLTIDFLTIRNNIFDLTLLTEISDTTTTYSLINETKKITEISIQSNRTLSSNTKKQGFAFVTGVTVERLTILNNIIDNLKGFIRNSIINDLYIKENIVKSEDSVYFMSGSTINGNGVFTFNNVETSNGFNGSYQSKVYSNYNRFVGEAAEYNIAE